MLSLLILDLIVDIYLNYRLKVNNTSEVLVVTVEVEVKSEAGLHWGGSSGVINLGMGGSLQPPIQYPIALKNSAKKPIKVMVNNFVNIIYEVFRSL